MFIVYGTRHYGKANRIERSDNCSQCGAFGKLQSYDAGKFFTLYLIPLIPLGSKRITDSCPKCKRHFEASLGKYNKEKKKDLGEAVANLKAHPEDPDRAIQAIQTFIRYNEFSEFDAMADGLGKLHASNANVMNTIGSAAEYLGKLNLAAVCFRQACNTSDAPDHAVDLTRVLLRQDKVAEAEPLFQPIYDGKQPKNVGLIYLLVDVYRHKGEHAKALEALDRIAKLEPALAEEDAHLSLVKTSTAAMANHKPIRSRSLGAPLGVRTRKGTATWLPAIVLPAILALAAGGYLWACYRIGRACPAWLVNGTGVTYSVDVGGKTYKLRAHGRYPIEVRQGDILMKIHSPDLPIAPTTVRVHTPFFSRPMNKACFVLNPDEQALIIKQRNTYSGRTLGDVDMPYSVQVGQSLHVFEAIDYEFQDFPESISVDTAASVVHRWRVYNLKPEPGISLLEVAFEALAPAQIAPFIKRRLLEKTLM